MKKRFLLAILFFVSLLNLNAYSQNALSPISEREEILKKAKLQERDGFLVLNLSGTPYEMGYQHGALLKEQIKDIFSNYILGYLTSEEHQGGLNFFSRRSLLRYFRYRAEVLGRFIPKDYREELRGLAEASGLSYADVLLMHTFLDTASLPKINVDSKFRDLLKECKVVFFYRPRTGNPFVAIGCPGIIGTLTGMNERGVTLDERGAEKTRLSTAGVPILILLRQVLQYSDSLYDGIRFISSSPRTIADIVIIGDIRINKGCIIEFNTKNYVVRFQGAGIGESLDSFLNLKDELGISVIDEKPIDPFEFYSYEKKSFPHKLELVEKTVGYKHYSFSYPSVVETDYPEDIVYLDFYEPRGQDTYPAVIFLSHLAGGTPQIEGAFCRDLASNGIAALLVQTAFQKEYRFTRTWIKEELKQKGVDELIQLLRQLIIEARRGIDWLEELPKIEKDRIGIMGISLGGIIVPVISGVDDRIKSMVIILGGGDIGEIIWNGQTTRLYKKRLIEEGIRSAWELERRWWMLDPLTFAFKSKARPSMMINARFDIDVSRASTLKLWRTLEQPKLSWLPTGHYTSIFTIGYAKIKTIQHFYANLVDKEKARKLGVDYTPGTPFDRFRFGFEEIFGEKTKLNISGRISEGIKRLRFGVITKNLFNTPYFGGSEIFGRKEKDERYNLEGAGGAVLLGRRLSEHTSSYLKHSFETVNVYDVKSFAPSDFHRHIGRNSTSIFSLNLERNTFDDSLYPIDGSYRALSAEVASKALGGDFNFTRLIGEASWYITMGYPKITFVFRVKGGWIDEFGSSEDVPFFERFYVGGSNTVRGYRSRLIGPKDSMGLPLWGEIMAIANAEARFPIFKRLNGAVFFDTGSTWEKFSKIDLSSDFKSSVGVGLRLKTDWAVLRLDYGYPLDRDPGDPRGKFHLALGLPF